VISLGTKKLTLPGEAGIKNAKSKKLQDSLVINAKRLMR